MIGVVFENWLEQKCQCGLYLGCVIYLSQTSEIG